MNHAKEIETNLAVIGLIDVGNSERTNGERALRVRIVALPRDRVDDRLAQLGLALERDVVAQLDVAAHVDRDLGRVLVLASQERRPFVLLVAQTDAKSIVNVRIYLDHVLVSIIYNKK